MLTQSVSLFEQATRSADSIKLTQYFMNHGVIDRIDAAHRAYVAIGQIVQKQAFILAFSDIFYLLGAALIVALAAVHDAQEARPASRPAAHTTNESTTHLHLTVEKNSHVEG